MTFVLDVLTTSCMDSIQPIGYLFHKQKCPILGELTDIKQVGWSCDINLFAP